MLTSDVLEPRPDFYIAAMGRSGSTALGNWFTQAPERLVFSEPFLTRTANPRLLRIQLADFGMPASDWEWGQADESASDRFRRLMAPRLRNRRWAFKEVLCEEHERVLAMFAPPRLILTVRDMRDVALSFFEKHRIQQNLHRFSDAWVEEYCLRESDGLVCLRNKLDERGIAHRVARYEDFTRSAEALHGIAAFVGWEGGGRVDSHLAKFDRQFEAHRHGAFFSDRPRLPDERQLGPAERLAADEIGERCSAYQAAFGYA